MPVAAAVLSPLLLERPGPVEHGDAVMVLVGDIDILPAVDGEGRRQPELPVSVAVGAELAEVLLVESAHTDSSERRVPIQHVDAAALADGEVHGVPEASAGRVVVHYADGLEIAQTTSICSIDAAQWSLLAGWVPWPAAARHEATPDETPLSPR